jgi:Mce-associated membrane protein
MAEHAGSPDGELSASTESTSTGDITEGRSQSEASAEAATTAAEPDIDDESAYTQRPADPEHEENDDADAPVKRRWPDVRLALIVGLIVIVALAGLVGSLGYSAHQSHQAEQQRKLFLRVARQGAVNLTTISYTEADADVRRILDSSTGAFHDDFQKRSQPFIDVVKQAQSKSVGTIAEAGLESVQGDEAQALVAVSVKMSNAGAADQPPRNWRMRISVQKVGDGVKVSNVAFVP